MPDLLECPTCRSSLPAAGGACPVCEATRTSAPADGDATRTSAPASHAEFLATVTRGADPVDLTDGAYRFAPGDLIGERYRIVQPLGRGGMGEVYRADDLSLGVSVALKILPERLASNPTWLSRFRKEVAAARQVSHPHVCRVYDIAEVDGLSMLSMEFIAGDDLAAIIRKVGRLSSGLAIDLTRQIARGLDAVHDEGLVHRDLKPANVMIDGRGRAKLADFGLAATAASVQGHDAYAGTPAYQAPEQLEGGELSERTDLYALGVLAYELLTGRRPYGVTDRDGLIRAQKDPPPPPSAFDATVPPEVDRIVLKCLSHDPLKRPASAAEVFRTLPGDAALNAALAAGVTPTAQVVADAGGEGRLSRRVAFLLTAASLLFIGLIGLMQYSTHYQYQETDLKPEELRERCRALLIEAGHPADVPYSASGITFEDDLTRWRDRNDLGPGRLDPAVFQRLTPNPFWYRVSPIPLVPHMPVREQPLVRDNDPAFGTTGSAIIVVDGRGRLKHLKRLPPASRPPAPLPSPDWPAWFRHAGLDFASFRPRPPERVWTVPSDTRRSWEGVFPERPNIPLTVEAATDRGELVAFCLVAPWTVPETDDGFTLESMPRYQAWSIAVPVLMLIVGGWFAIRHVRAGVADVRGAFRFALGFGCLHAAMYFLFVGQLNLTGRSLTTWYVAFALVVLNTARLAVGYLALEPFVRRRWPWRLIGWRRLLDGRFRDPWVGRDVLIAMTVGLLAGLIGEVFNLLPGFVGRPPELPVNRSLIWTLPVRFLSPLVLVSVDVSMILFFLLFCLTRLLRTAWLWVPAIFTTIMLVVFASGGGANPDIISWGGPIFASMSLMVFLRKGLLAHIVAMIASFTVLTYPIFYGWGTWFWPASAVAWAILLTFLTSGLVVSVGGWRRLLRGDSPESS
jgi:hypothetical protein